GFDNATIRCLPWSTYLIDRTDTAAQRGQIMAYATRGLGPRFKDGTIFVKRVHAVPGDRVRVDAGGVFVNGIWRVSLDRDTLARAGLTEEELYRDVEMAEDELFMLGDLPKSYDGRYTGPIKI